MRGSRTVSRFEWRAAGIIPAHAGLTDAERKAETYDWDHPRACGAHLRLVAVAVLILGSSPRMRGSPSYPRQFIKLVGIIPAHAGLT